MKPRRRRRNGHVQKAIGLMSKTATLHMRHAFLYISLPPLHNYDVKWLKFRSTWERRRQGDKFYNPCLDSGEVPSLQLQPISSLLLTNRVTWDICEIVDLKGWGVCFSATFSWTSLLSDCKVLKKSSTNSPTIRFVCHQDLCLAQGEGKLFLIHSLKWNLNNVLTTCKAIIKGLASGFVYWSCALRHKSKINSSRNKAMAFKGGIVSHYYSLVVRNFIDFMSLFRHSVRFAFSFKQFSSTEFGICNI